MEESSDENRIESTNTQESWNDSIYCKKHKKAFEKESDTKVYE